jgi:CRP/FNR family cyclic AMP-dependent transcriptional regulator
MTTPSLLTRFQGEDGQRRLIELLHKQAVVAGNPDIAKEIAGVARLVELRENEVLVRQDAPDNDVYLLLSGRMRVNVNGRDVAIRGPGEHIGEMAVIDSASPRTATVVAAELSILAKLSEAEFAQIADRHSSVWKALALQLCKRLNERKRFHAEPNAKPIIFIGSSSERRMLAEAIANGIPSHIADVRVWTIGVFEASSFPIDDLDAQLRVADFALLVGAADDEVTSRGTTSDAPRDNVVFELGLFMGALSRHRTFLAVPTGAKVKIPTDLLGLNNILYDGSATNPIVAVKSAVDELVGIVEKKGPK